MVLLEKAKYKFFNVDFICLALVEWETSMLLLKSGFLLHSQNFPQINKLLLKIIFVVVY